MKRIEHDERRPATEGKACAENIAALYQDRFLRGYVRGKVRGDPVYAAAFHLLNAAPMPVLDIGCGLGLFEFYLRERGYEPALTGVDFDARKIGRARHAAGQQYTGLTFTTEDALAGPAHGGHVVLLDMLHYIDADRQARLLARVAAQVAPGGYCLIRDTLRDGSWRFRVTAFGEWVASLATWQKSPAVHYPTVPETCAPFSARGFSCEVKPLWGKTFFNSYLFTFRAPAA